MTRLEHTGLCGEDEKKASDYSEALRSLTFRLPYLLKNQCILSPIPDIDLPLRKRMGMNIIKINTDNFILPITMDEVLSAIYQLIEKTVAQPVIMVGEQRVTLASHFVRSIESHGRMVSVKQCPFIGERIFFHAVWKV